MWWAWVADWRRGGTSSSQQAIALSTAATACKLRPPGRGSWCSSSPVHCPAELAAKAANLLHRQSKHSPPSSCAHLVGALGALHHQPRQLAGRVEGHVDQQLLIGVRLQVQPIVLPVPACMGGTTSTGSNGSAAACRRRLQVQAIVLAVAVGSGMADVGAIVSSCSSGSTTAR